MNLYLDIETIQTDRPEVREFIAASVTHPGNISKAETIAKVAGTLVNKALKGDTASAIFYLKTQAGWRETSNVNLQTDREVVINMSRRAEGNG